MKAKGREGQTWATVATVARKGGWEHQGLVLQGGSIRLGKTEEVLDCGKLHAFEEGDWEHVGSLKRIA